MRSQSNKRAIAGAIGIPVALVALALPLGASAGKGDDKKPIKGPTVKVADDFYSPTSIKIKPNTQVNFKWSPENTNPHNVVLQKGPKGVKKGDFKSATGSIGIKFKPVFETKGAYDLLCTIHPDVMKLKATVGK